MKFAILALCLMLSSLTLADEAPNTSIETCLDHWGTHPFGKNPKYRTMSTLVKIFGIGSNPVDDDKSRGVTVMGSTRVELVSFKGNRN